MATGQDWLNAGRNPVLRVLIRRIREHRRERQ
jgi:hypothetical protein